MSRGRKGRVRTLSSSRCARQLRTPQPWFSSVERIWREVDVMRVCQEVLDRAHDPQLVAQTPRLLFEDRENYAFGMTAAPREHHVWKRDLLDGLTDPNVASQCGRLLGRLHAGTWRDEAIEKELGDLTIFDELRLDPYYRSIAAARSEYALYVERLIASTLEHRRSLTLADFTPKNLLVWDGGLMMVDFETGHYGDPAFDLGLFVAHLVLKTVMRWNDRDAFFELTDEFWKSYQSVVQPLVGLGEYEALVRRGLQHLAGCMAARLDGKSRVDYLDDPHAQDVVRQLCLAIFQHRPGRWVAVTDELKLLMDQARISTL